MGLRKRALEAFQQEVSVNTRRKEEEMRSEQKKVIDQLQRLIHESGIFTPGVFKTITVQQWPWAMAIVDTGLLVTANYHRGLGWYLVVVQQCSDCGQWIVSSPFFSLAGLGDAIYQMDHTDCGHECDKPTKIARSLPGAF